jgi:Tfp pilus assembly protein PilF
MCLFAIPGMAARRPPGSGRALPGVHRQSSIVNRQFALRVAPFQVSATRQATGILEPTTAVSPDEMVETITAARHEIGRAPTDPRGYLRLGRALRIAGDTDAASRALDHALALDPRLSGAWYEKGLMAIESGTLPEATNLFEKAVGCDASNASAHLQLASLLLRRGDWTRAQSELQAVLRTDPSNAGAHDGLGMVLNQQGDPQAAVEEFRKALELRPSFAEAEESLGETLVQLGQWSEASAALKKALAGNLEDRSMATYALASVLKHLGDAPAADAEYAKARELMRRRVTEDRAKGSNDRGLQLWYSGDLAGAEAALRSAIAEDPAYAEAHNNLGGVLWQQQKTAEAQHEFAEAVRLDPGFAKAHNNLGNALLGTGDIDGAVRELRAAVAGQPGFASAHLNLAIALMKKGDNRRAEDEIERTLELDPDMAEAHVEEGLLLVTEANRLTPAARKQFEAGLHLNPDLRAAIPLPVYEELLLGN